MSENRRNASEKDGCVKAQSPNWIKNNDIDFSDRNFQRIIDFYLLKSPAENLSARGRTLESYGWNNTYDLKRKIGLISKLKPSMFAFADALKEMEEALKDSNLYQRFWENHKERVCLYIVKNQLNSLFYHIRNSFAHGRFDIIKTKTDNIFVMEDVNKKYISARMVLKESTLLNWIDIIEHGEFK